jgi:hypothetical protein
MNPHAVDAAASDAGGRAAEAAAKLRLLREALAEGVDGRHAGAIRLRGADWFAWATAGAAASPLLADDANGAELLVTADEACVLADAVEAERLRADGLADGFTFHIAPWAEPELHERYVLGAAGGATVLSDRPQRAEAALPHNLRLRRTVLTPAEQERLRLLGRDAALQRDVLQAEATGLDAVRPGQSLAAVVHALDAAYRHADRLEAIQAAHQGGITGYLPYELLAGPSTATGIETGMAFALAPGLPGMAVQDTFLLCPAGLDNLTADPGWPSTTVGGRARPLWLENAP